MDKHFMEQPDRSQQEAKEPQARKRRVIGNGIVLALFVLVSVCATGLVLRSSAQPARASGGAPTPTPTSSTPVPGQRLPQGSLYMATPGSLARVDLKTGTVLWTLQVNSPLAPLVVGPKLFFENADSTSPFLESANAQTGAQLWQVQNPGNGFLLGDHNMLYDSLCDFATNTCALYGINASTGVQVWSYNLPRGNAWIALENGVVYGVSYTDYFALNAATGAPLWQKNLLNYTNQEANTPPVVRGGVLSFVSCTTTKPPTGFTGCYLYAFQASTGQERWHMATISKLWSTPAIMDGVVYAGAIDDGTLYALNEQTGQQLWSVDTGGQVSQLFASEGTIYVGAPNPDGQGLNVAAFNTRTHAPLWGQLASTGQPSVTALALAQHAPGIASRPFMPRGPRSGGPEMAPFLVHDGFVYLPGNNTLAVLNASNGNLVTSYPVPGGFLSGFTVAG